MAITFQVSATNPNPVKLDGAKQDYVTTLPEYRSDCDNVLQGSTVGSASLLPLRNGFVNTVVNCYNQHHNLILRPDDIWLAVMAQFAYFVNGNSEAMRHLFVKHEGKREVEVCAIGNLHSVDYGSLSKLMADKLRSRLNEAADARLADWILPGFSTTTDNDTIAGSVLMMGTLKSYFSYKFSLMCGIPRVTLQGTPEDWEDIKFRVEKLALYEGYCVKWSHMLKTVMSEFVEASQGKVNIDFWQRICHYHGGGSGPRYLSGWITAFCVFNEQGKWQGDRTWASTMLGEVNTLEFAVVDTNDIPAGYVTVDVTVDDNGVEHKTKMFSGHMACQVVDECTLAPTLLWAICLLKPADQRGERRPF